MAAIDDLKREVQESRTVTQSAVALLQGLRQRLDDALASGNTEADIRAVIDDLDAQQADLAAAITANTPAEGTEPTDPEQPAG